MENCLFTRSRGVNDFAQCSGETTDAAAAVAGVPVATAWVKADTESKRLGKNAMRRELDIAVAYVFAYQR